MVGNITTILATNITATTSSPPCSPSFPIASTPVFFITGLLIIIENILGMAVIYSTSVLHTTPNIFICSMAVTDIAAGLACLLASVLILSGEIPGAPEYLPSYGIGIVLAVFAMVILSCAHMAIIAVERYLYIAHPLPYKKYMSQRTISIILIVYWVCSFVYLCFLFGTYFVSVTPSICKRQLPPASVLILSFTIYMSSVVISCTVYARITKISLTQKRKHMNQTSIRLDSIEIKRRKSVVQKEKMFKETMKSIKFFIAVFGIFLVFTLPTAVTFLIDQVIAEVPNTVFRLVTSPAIFNSGVNFLVLTYLNSTFKEALKTKVCGFCRRRRNGG